MNSLIRSFFLTCFSLFTSFEGNTQILNYVVLDDSMFVSICVEKDTSWSIGNINQRNDSIFFQQRLIFDYTSDSLLFSLIDEGQQEIGIQINDIESIKSDFYSSKLKEYLFRLLDKTWRQADVYYQLDLEKSQYYYRALKSLVDFIDSPELEFIKTQLSLMNESIDDLGQMALNSFREGDMNMTLFYSRVYRLLNRTLSDQSFKVQEAEMDAILALDFNGEYVPYIEENLILTKKLLDWKSQISEAQNYFVTKTCIR
jgi:hypothetical protein